MTQEHKDLLISKCSGSENVVMPDFTAQESKNNSVTKSENICCTEKNDITKQASKVLKETKDPQEHDIMKNSLDENNKTEKEIITIAKCEKKESLEDKIDEMNDVNDPADDTEASTIGEEVWECVKIMSIEAVRSECPIKCSMDNCPLPAAVAYVSNRAPTEKWYGCLDCQVRKN